MMIFSTCKPFGERDHVDMIQTNALASWSRIPGVSVVLIGDDNGVSSAAEKFGFAHEPNVELTSGGTPKVKSLWKIGIEYAAGGLCAYVNSDILLQRSFADTIGKVSMDKFLLTGKRWNANVNRELAPEECDAMFHRTEGSYGLECAMDYFAFRGDFWGEIPDFAVGRYVWDNWLMWRPLSIGVPAIDATDAITIVHQSHDLCPWLHDEANANRAVLSGGMCGTKDATHIMGSDGVVHAK